LPPPPLGPPGSPPPGTVVGATLDDGVVVGVVVLLGPPLWPPPQATDNTSIAAPPSSATVVLGPDLIRSPNLHMRHFAPPTFSYPGASPRKQIRAAKSAETRMARHGDVTGHRERRSASNSLPECTRRAWRCGRRGRTCRAVSSRHWTTDAAPPPLCCRPG
ncbi:hypothetical protein DQP57_25480, partial [Mycobacterium colombiense]